MATWNYRKEDGYVREYEDGKIEDLYQSLKKHGIGGDVRKKIMKSGGQIKKTSKKEEKAEWFFNAMNVMDELLDEETKKKVREDCACCLGGKRHELCKSVNKEYKTPEERIQAIDSTHFIFGHEIKIIEPGKYEVKFFDETIAEKRCSCLKVVMNKKMSKTYCYCCGNHVRQHLETTLGKKLKVEVVTSALSSMGKNSCRFILEEVMP